MRATLCPECKTNALPEPLGGVIHARRCFECGLRWAEAHWGLVIARKEPSP